MRFFAIIARAFMESRQRQAARIIRDHSYLTRGPSRIAANNMNVIEVATPRPEHAAPEFKLAA